MTNKTLTHKQAQSLYEHKRRTSPAPRRMSDTQELRDARKLAEAVLKPERKWWQKLLGQS